jgi:hypothetical protein
MYISLTWYFSEFLYDSSSKQFNLNGEFGVIAFHRDEVTAIQLSDHLDRYLDSHVVHLSLADDVVIRIGFYCDENREKFLSVMRGKIPVEIPVREKIG